MSDQSDPTIHQYSAPPPCLVCGEGLQLRLARGRESGKPFVMLRCGRDGRHYRAFIHDPDFVRRVLARLEDRTPASTDRVDLDANPDSVRPSGAMLEPSSGP